MQVNIFVTERENTGSADFLVLPFAPQATASLREKDDWQYYATVDSRDGIFGDVDGRAIEIEIERSGHALVKTKASSQP